MTKREAEPETSMSDEERKALVKALVRLIRDDELRVERMKRLREGADNR